MTEFTRTHERLSKDFVVSFVNKEQVHAHLGGDISFGGFSFIVTDDMDHLDIGDEIKVKITNTLIGSSYVIEKSIVRNRIDLDDGVQLGCQILSIDAAQKNRHELFCVSESIKNQQFDGDISAHFINQAKDAVIALNLSIGQIESSLHGTHHSSEQVSNAVVEMHSLVNHWQKTIENPDLSSDEKVKVLEHQLPLYFEHKSKSTIAVQFFDRLSQRLTHVSQCLLSMAHIFGDHDKFVSDDAWAELMNDFKRAYFSQGDMDAFDQLSSGLSIQEAMVLMIRAQTDQEIGIEEDDIELF